ncbi:MAG: coiled-coil protein [Candidatus Micrarchaeia archaeon]
MSEKSLSASQLRASRDEANKKVRELVSENRERILQVKNLSEKSTELKAKRDELNAKANDLRAKRRKVVDELVVLRKKLREKIEQVRALADVGSSFHLKERIEQLEWHLQTQAVGVAQEKKLSKEARALESFLEPALKKDALRESLTVLRGEVDQKSKKADDLFSQIKGLSKEAGFVHKELVSDYKKTQKLREKISSAFSVLDEARKKADQEHSAFVKVSKGDVQKKKEKFKTAKEHKAKELQKHKAKVSSRAREIFDQFKAGKKISSDELLVLQEAGLF